MMLIFQAVLAADISSYAAVSTVTLPPVGPVRVALPPDVVGGASDALSGGLLLLNAAGEPVPYGVIRSSAGGPMEEERLYARPVDSAVWEVERAEAPADALVLYIDDLAETGPFRATVSWRDDDGWESADTTVVYANDLSEGRTIEVPHVEGPFRVSLEPMQGGRARLDGVYAQRGAPDHVPRNVETVPAPVPVITEDGTARYTLHLGGPRDVRAIRFELPASVDVADRSVNVRTPDGMSSYGTLRRNQVGAAAVDRVEIPVEGLVGDTLIVDISLERGAPLDIDELDVLSEGAYLVARDAGAGPHRLYSGANVQDTVYDLTVALPELLREAPPQVEAAGLDRNPDYVPIPTAEGVDVAGPDLALGRFRWERAIVPAEVEGPAGWVRVTIGRDVLARARRDLADVRVVDAEGRQLPFLLWEGGVEETWSTPTFERTEEGGSSLLRVPLDGTSPIGTVYLDTSKGVFERDVTLLRDAGRTTVAIRRVTWRGPDRGGTLAVHVGERVGDALLVRIDNRDNPPLPIDAVRVTSPTWDLRVRVPDGGARLVYGAPGAEAPWYDLSILTADVRRVPVTNATLGEERALETPTPGIVDRGATVAGIGLLAIGLVGMVVRVLRGVAVPTGEGDRSGA